MSMLLSLLALPASLHLTPHTPLHLNPLQRSLTCQHTFQALSATLQLRTEGGTLQALASLQLGGWQWSLSGHGQGRWQLGVRRQEASEGMLEMPLLQQRLSGGEDEGRIVEADEAVVEEAALEGLVEEEDSQGSQDLDQYISKQRKELEVKEKILSLVSEQHQTLLYYCFLNKSNKIFYVPEINGLFSNAQQFEMLFFKTDKREILNRWKLGHKLRPSFLQAAFDAIFSSSSDQKDPEFRKRIQSFIKKPKISADMSGADFVVSAMTEPFKNCFEEREKIEHGEQAPLVSFLLLFNFPQLRSFLMHGREDQWVSMKGFFNSSLFKKVVKDFVEEHKLPKKTRKEKVFIFKKIMESLLDQKIFKERTEAFIQSRKLEAQTTENDFKRFWSKGSDFTKSLFHFYSSESEKNFKKKREKLTGLLFKALRNREDHEGVNSCRRWNHDRNRYPTHAEIKAKPHIKESSAVKFFLKMAPILKSRRSFEDTKGSLFDDANHLYELLCFSSHLKKLISSFQLTTLPDLQALKDRLKSQLTQIEDLDLPKPQQTSADLDKKSSVECFKGLLELIDRVQLDMTKQWIFLLGDIEELRKINVASVEFEDELKDQIEKLSQDYLACLEQEVRIQEIEDLVEAFKEPLEEDPFENMLGKPQAILSLETLQSLAKQGENVEAWLKRLEMLDHMLCEIKNLGKVGIESVERLEKPKPFVSPFSPFFFSSLLEGQGVPKWKR